MSDVKNLYTLKQPLTENEKDNIVYGIGPVSEDLFQPLDIPAIQKQLEGHLTSFIVNVTEYVDLCDHAQNAEELNAIRGHFNRCQHEHIAEVLAVFGLENKETE